MRFRGCRLAPLAPIASGAIGTFGSMDYDGRRPRLSVELARRVDGARGQVPFERWVREALEAVVAGEAVEQPVGEVSGVVGPSRLGEANEARGPAGRASGSRALAPQSPRASRPQRHEFGSGGEWQDAVRVWKAAQ